MARDRLGKIREQQDHAALRTRSLNTAAGAEKHRTGFLFRKTRTLRAAFCVLLFLAVFCLVLSCGIDEYVFLDRPRGIPDRQSDTRVEIPVSPYSSSFFTGYVLFYRIYLSDSSSSGGAIPDTDFASKNPQLASDYSALEPYTDDQNTTVSTTNIINQFLNRRYFSITLENPSILSPSGADRLIIDFSPPQQQYPTASLASGAETRMRRLEGLNATNADLAADAVIPSNRYFRNENSGITGTMPVESPPKNRDVQTFSGATATHAYIALYIVTSGMDTYLAAIYSRPTFVGVFYIK